MKGSMQAQVNRTQLPSGGGQQNGVDRSQEPETKSGQSQEQIQKETQDPNAAQSPGEDKSGITSQTPLLGAFQGYQQEADKALGLNPAYGHDWWKKTLENPVESYYFGRHIFKAFYGAFLDSRGIEASVHDIWHQDNAVGWLLRNPAFENATDLTRAGQALGTTPENVAAGEAGAVLPITADPQNVLFANMAGARGVELVGKMLAPTAINAIFGDRHSTSDLTWGVLPAILLGGKLPPEVAAQVERVAPGALKVFDRLSAARRAQDAAKVFMQDNKQFVKRLQDSIQSKEATVWGRAWQAGMQGKGKEWEISTGRQLMAKYGTLDPDKLIPAMMQAGESIHHISDVWTYLVRKPYDLLQPHADAPALIDPSSYTHLMPTAVREEYKKGQGWLQAVFHQANAGTAGNAAAPEASLWRSMIGQHRTNNTVVDQFQQRLLNLAGGEATHEGEQALLRGALEGDEVSYQSQSVAGKIVRDEIRMALAAVMQASKESGYSESEVSGFLPRLPLLVRDGTTFRPARPAGDLFTKDPLKHRTLTVNQTDLLTESRMQVEQKYKTIEEAQAAVSRLRTTIADGILRGAALEDITGITREVDGPAIERIRSIAQADPEVAIAEAKRLAEQIAPDFDLNPYSAVTRYLRGRLNAIATHRAIGDLLMAQGRDGKAIAVMRAADDRANAFLRAQGYSAVNVPGFEQVLVNQKFGELLTRATRLHNVKSARDLKSELGLAIAALKNARPGEAFGHLKEAWPTLLELESTAIAMIMYSPRIHGMNMAARLGILGMLHPQQVSEWFKGGMIQAPWETRTGFEPHRLEAWNTGVLPPHVVKGLQNGFAEPFIKTLGELTGDTDLGMTPLLRDMSGSSEAARASSGAKAVLGQIKNLAWGNQSDLWSWVSDFGVMAYHIEKAAAINSRRFGSEAEAAMYAARRANSWMGHVAPEDTNPVMHAVARAIFFAPNWWRTWAEILTGYYKNAGFGWSRDTITYVVQNELKTALAAFGLQQMTANAMNAMLTSDHHTIYQNDPGNWGKVEITAPWAIAVVNKLFNLGIDPKTGRDAKGRKLTMENPIARQAVDTEQLMGLLTSAPHWSPQTAFEGASAFTAGRLSPVADAFAALGNIDLYRSVSSGGLRYVDPNHDTFMGADQSGANPGTNLADLIAAGGDLTPFGNVSQQVQQEIMQGNVQNVNVMGVPVPKAILDSLSPQSVGQDLVRAFMVGMTGVNPPYMRSSKTMGVSPTDDQYKAVHELQDKYQQRMSALSTSSLSGQMAPYQWLATYRQLSAQHAAEMQALFLHSPEYRNGPLGLTASYEGLYDQATDKQGILEPDKLRSLQHEWRSQHSAADYAAVQNELHSNDQKYPMLALYHKTQDAYYNWQADWCKENGVDLATLQSDMSGWSYVYNDRNASRAWVTAHPEITQFENAKKNEFESGNSKYGMAGLMYALFFNPTAADRFLAVSGETAQQVEQQVQAEQVPAAP